MLQQGKAVVDEFKGEAEGVVSQVQETIETITGLWGWIQGLFGANPKPSAEPVESSTPAAGATPKPAAKSQKKTKEPELSYEEYQARAVHEICENLKVYFEAIRPLKAHCRELEEESLVTDKVADSAIDLIEMQWQLKQLSAQLKQSMIYGTPHELGLGAMYQEFLAKYEEILEEQDIARELKRKQERDIAWQHEHREQILLAKLGYVIVLTVSGLWVMGLFLAL